MVTLHEVITFLVSMQISISSLQTHNVNRCGRSRHLARKLSLRRKRSSPNVFEMAATETITSIILIKLIRVSLGTVRHPRRFKIVLLFLAIIQTFFLISWFSLLLLQLLRHLFYRHLKLHRQRYILIVCRFMLVMVVLLLAFKWIHLSTSLIRLFLLVLILILLPSLSSYPLSFTWTLVRFLLPSRLPMMFILWMVAMMVVIIPSRTV